MINAKLDCFIIPIKNLYKKTIVHNLIISKNILCIVFLKYLYIFYSKNSNLFLIYFKIITKV